MLVIQIDAGVVPLKKMVLARERTSDKKQSFSYNGSFKIFFIKQKTVQEFALDSLIVVFDRLYS